MIDYATLIEVERKIGSSNTHQSYLRFLFNNKKIDTEFDGEPCISITYDESVLDVIFTNLAGMLDYKNMIGTDMSISDGRLIVKTAPVPT